MSVSVQSSTFSVANEYECLLGQAPGAAVSTFSGYVRDHSALGRVDRLHLEHYPGMAEVVLRDVGISASERFKLLGWRIIHRYGALSVDDIIVWVGTVAHHRAEAMSACEFIMDRLKTDAPFWKHESGADGESWVAAAASDSARRRRW